MNTNNPIPPVISAETAVWVQTVKDVKGKSDL